MPIPERLLNGRARHLTLNHLFESSSALNLYKGERALLCLTLPPWQRQEVWAHAQKVQFIEGIFLGFDLGQYVVNGSDWDDNADRKPMSGWLIDGQQRISALRDFVRGELTIFGDVTHGSLTPPQAMRFLRTPFVCFELDYTSDEASLRALYDRLNFAGTPHEEHQRASLYQG